MIGWITTAFVVGAFAVMLYARHRARYDEQLRYDTHEPDRPGGLSLAMRRFVEACAVAAWGSGSTQAWERRCLASLHASRRRRGLDDGT